MLNVYIQNNLPLRVFVTSSDLRRALTALGVSSLPNSTTAVKQMVMAEGQRIRTAVKGELVSKKKKGQQFSITFDEWTSTRNQRYMNVNVHEDGPTFWSLGLTRVHGSMPAEKCVALLEQKLSEFGLCLETDIVGMCTDGASVMTKVGKLLHPEQ